MEREEYEACIVGRSPRSVKLLDCRDHQRSPEFILKIAPFSEIPLTPTFSSDALVYFMGQQELCSQSNLKLVVRTQNSADTLPVNHQNRPTVKTNKSAKLVQRNTFKDTMSANTEQPSQDSWEKYRFLIIPAALGLLTLCGIQAVICALWKPGKGLFSRHRHKPLICGCCATGQPAPSTLGDISSASHLSHSVEYIDLVGLRLAIQNDQTCENVKILDDSVNRAEISLPENCRPLPVNEVKSEEFRAANTDRSCQWSTKLKVNHMVHFLPTDIVQTVDKEETWKPRAQTANICVFSCGGVREQPTSVPPSCQQKCNYLHMKSRKASSDYVINIAV
ncbi:unnamed protein product [Calicophoron daubneyi]|uniref:Uncharacterized protein n=1 Tax=Calicophoron daubneyi TaxID=300641 RepID=A0AAV2TE90_CALDB